MAHHKKQLPTKTIQQYSNDWKTVSLNDTELFGFANGLWKGKKPPYITVKVLRNTNFNNDGTLDLSNVAELDVELNQFEKRKLIPGDIILERSGGGPFQPVGRVVYFNIEEGLYSFSNFTSRIRVENPTKIKPKFLLYSLLNFYNNGGTYELQQKTTGIRNLSFSEYIKISIPIPPLPEQKKIAAVLFRIQQAVETQEKILSSLQELKKSTMEYLFNKNQPYNSNNIFVADLGEIITGTTPPTAQKEYYEIGEYQFIAPIDLGNTTGIYNSEKQISQLGLEVSRVLPKYSVCFVCIGSTIGKVGITVAEQSSTNQQINSIVTDDKFNPFYVTFLLQHYSKYIASFSSPSPVPILSKGKFSKIPLLVTLDKSSQDNIANTLKTIDESIELTAKKQAALKQLFLSTLNKLMTGEIRVNDLDVEVKEVK